MEYTEKIANILTPMRIKILHTLKEEKHPEELARLFNVTRQAIDKHLSLLYKFGLVDKIVRSEARPMVFYQITLEGENLLANFEDVSTDYVISIKNRIKEELFSLDKMLVNGEISEKDYLKDKKSLEKRFEWVMKK